ncbi:hypothetical protein Emag_001464 [Eimeria magna]
MSWRSSRPAPRRATHAGSWYDSNKASLAEELRRYLEGASKTCHGTAKAIICPHAGLRFSGPTAAYAWKQVDPSAVKRVFLLGPSHCKYFRGVALPPEGCPSYATPLGDLPLDNGILDALRRTQAFSDLSPSEDEAEHSIELLLPFEIVFAFSSDFCHWGPRQQQQQQQLQQQLVELAAAKGCTTLTTELLAYSQSSPAMTRSDSSVSYAALCTTRSVAHMQH